MSEQQIYFPALVLVGLTFVVWLRLYVSRIGEMKRERIHPQAIATSAQAAARLTDTRAADNFRNLFELPVLFYAAVLLVAQSGLESPVTVGLAWAFVALRLLHSWIHCTYNKVMHRFGVYVAGGFALWALWGAIAWGLLL
jgi:hypothetical protein